MTPRLVITFAFRRKPKKQLVSALGLRLDLIYSHSCSNTSSAAILTSRPCQLQFQLTQERSAESKLQNFTCSIRWDERTFPPALLLRRVQNRPPSTPIPSFLCLQRSASLTPTLEDSSPSQIRIKMGYIHSCYYSLRFLVH
jgi:hypothetical protein